MEKPLGELLEAFVATGLGMGKDLLDVWPKSRLSETVAGSGLRPEGIAPVGSFKQSPRGSLIERRIARSGKLIAHRNFVRILANERP